MSGTMSVGEGTPPLLRPARWWIGSGSGRLDQKALAGTLDPGGAESTGG